MQIDSTVWISATRGISAKKLLMFVVLITFLLFSALFMFLNTTSARQPSSNLSGNETPSESGDAGKTNDLGKLADIITGDNRTIPLNRPPKLNPIGNVTVQAKTPIKFIVSGSDPDNDFFVFSVSKLPSGASFDPALGVFTWTPAQAGVYNFTFSISDGFLSSSKHMKIVVNSPAYYGGGGTGGGGGGSASKNNPPALNAIGDKTINIGYLLEFTVSGSDPDGQPLTFSASGLPPGAVFGPEFRKFSWVPAEPGIFFVVFSVSDGSFTSSESVKIVVNAVPGPAALVITGEQNPLSFNKITRMSWEAGGTEQAEEYHYAVGTTRCGTDVLNWISTGTNYVERDDLNIQCGRVYYLSVKAKNGKGFWSSASCSDGAIICPYKSMKHILAYFNMQESDIQFIASHFEIIDTVIWYEQAINEIKSLNANVTALGYKILIGMEPYSWYYDWDIVKDHEDWFVHDQHGHRLREDEYNYYLMDPASGFREQYANYIYDKLSAYPQFDGIFADNAIGNVEPWLRNSFHIEIVNEPSMVNADGSVATIYNIISGARYIEKNTIKVSINPDGSGINYYTGGSYSGNNMVLGTPLAPGTQVYVSYGAKNDMFRPTDEKIASWNSDVAGMLAAAKARIGSKKLVVNSAYRSDFLDYADGMMDEEFVHASWTKHDEFPPHDVWKKDIDDMVSAVSRGKLFLAQSGVNNTGNPDENNVKEMMFFCYASYRLGSGETSSFNFIKPSVSLYGSISYFPEWDIDLGYPLGSYYLLSEGITNEGSHGENLLQNPDFESGLDGWVSGSAKGNVITTIDESIKKNGQKSAKLEAASGINTGGIYQYVSLNPYAYYTASGWMRTENIQSQVYPAARIYLHPGKGGLTGSRDDGVFSGTQDWRYLNIVFRTGNDTAGAYLYAGQIREGNGTAWVDDIQIYEGSYPQYKIYARDFSKAKVIVNPTYGSHTVSLGETYTTIDGHAVDSIIIGPHEGVLLLKV